MKDYTKLDLYRMLLKKGYVDITYKTKKEAEIIAWSLGKYAKEQACGKIAMFPKTIMVEPFVETNHYEAEQRPPESGEYPWN